MSKSPTSLTRKLILIQFAFLCMALAAITLTLWVSWQLEGGAGAINEAGRMRMMTYRMLMLRQTGDLPALLEAATKFDHMVADLKAGDATRPMSIPADQSCRQSFDLVEQRWGELRPTLLGPQSLDVARSQAERFVVDVDVFVSRVEHTIATRTALLGGLCFGLVILVVGASVAFVSGTWSWIVQPLQRLRNGLADMAGRNFATRVNEANSVAEFAELAKGFNQMANALESSYRSLEQKVAEKTASLAQQNERLAALYDVTLMATTSNDSVEALGQQFAGKIARIAGADACAVRMLAEDGERLLMLGQHRLPQAMLAGERCVRMGECECGSSIGGGHDPESTRVIPIRVLGGQLGHCAQAGFQSVLAIPLRSSLRVLGEIELFYFGDRVLAEAEHQLLEALAGHFGAVVENVRLAARDRELAVSEERNLIAQELHDSIAQSLAFLKIQVQLLRTALMQQKQTQVDAALAEIDTGVRECYADVRELLVHFRTRAGHEDIEHALRTTLQKFEHQTGMPVGLSIEGQGVPLPPDQQVQVLHVLQEALSNVRKHANAKQVRVQVWQDPQWAFEVSDDGDGFSDDGPGKGEIHVGLRIMRERARRIGAQLQVQSQPGEGTRVTLTLPSNVAERAA